MADPAADPQANAHQMAAQRQATIQGQDDFETEELAMKVYDLIMADIEPDLLSYNIDLLDEYYAGENDEEHAERMARYEAAYAAFDRAFEEFMASIQEEVRDTRRTALRERESQARSDEEAALAALETAFS